MLQQQLANGFMVYSVQSSLYVLYVPTNGKVNGEKQYVTMGIDVEV